MPEGQKKAFAEGRSPPQELEEGPRSGPHLLVIMMMKNVSYSSTPKIENSYFYWMYH